jgi:hypothetical protein
MGAVLALHPMRMEHQVVADPDRVEAVALGGLGHVEQVAAGGVLAEVGQQQAVAADGVGHEVGKLPRPRLASSADRTQIACKIQYAANGPQGDRARARLAGVTLFHARCDARVTLDGARDAECDENSTV